MKKLNILVFPCGSEIGLELHQSLRYAKEVKLYGGSSVPDHGQFVYKNYIANIPFISDESFLSHVNDVIKEYNINFILPAHDSVVLQLAEYKHKDQLFCPVITSPLETCQITRSKKKTMAAVNSVIRVPHLYENIDDVSDFPVFLKPDIGQGSRGTVLVNTREEAQFHVSQNPNLLVLEFLPGAEYTIDCYTNSERDLIFCGARERCRISNGISVNTKPVYIEEIQQIAMRINELLNFQGMWFFQLKRAKNGELALMEIAPRLAGTMGMYRNLGVNFALMNIYEAQGYKVSAMPNTFDIEMDRSLCSRFKTNLNYDHVYIDFDDCILIDNKLNLSAVKFLYQCVNQGIKIHLITRHAGEIDDYLSNYRIDRLFDTVIHLKKGENKSQYIKYDKSIFIDDSFSERTDVLSMLNIPVFAPDAIESLIYEDI